MKRLILGLCLFLAGTPTLADIAGLPEPARTALETRAAVMSAALVAGDPAAAFDLLPPPFVARSAASVGRTAEEFRAMFIEYQLTLRPNTGVTDHRLDLAAATLFQGSDGATYALIPTESLNFDPYRGRFRLTGTTVGIPSGETWHFVTIADAAGLALLVDTYPALAEAPLAPATLTPAP